MSYREELESRLAPTAAVPSLLYEIARQLAIQNDLMVEREKAVERMAASSAELANLVVKSSGKTENNK